MTRGFVDDASFGVTGYALGEFQYPSLSAQCGYYIGTLSSLAIGCFNGSTELKVLNFGARRFGTFVNFSKKSLAAHRFSTGRKMFSAPKLGVGNVAKRSGRNRFVPDRSATGAHSVFRRDPITNITTHYQTYRPQTNPFDPKPWESVKRFDLSGRGHTNKVFQIEVPTPHIHDPIYPGKIRSPFSWEIPN